jgi:hypothetical protein
MFSQSLYIFDQIASSKASKIYCNLGRRVLPPDSIPQPSDEGSCTSGDIVFSRNLTDKERRRCWQPEKVPIASI